MIKSISDVHRGSRYVNIGNEPLPALNAAVLLFLNAPKDTQFVMLCIEDQAIRITFDGTDPVEATNHGLLFGLGLHELDMTYQEIRSIRAIEAAASATGYISYFKVVN
jgi:hypothetical protein